MPAVLNILGMRFGKLLVLCRSENSTRGKSQWLCRCDCGREKVVEGERLKRSTRSCGCGVVEATRRRSTTHGHTVAKSTSRAFRIWCAMRSRCGSPSNADWAHYGGRGIAVCERWQCFGAFLEDMGEPPPGMSIERTDNELGYYPGNCVWATADRQANNTRRNVFIRDGALTMTMADYSRARGIKYSTLRYHLRAGKTVICGRRVEAIYPSGGAAQ